MNTIDDPFEIVQLMQATGWRAIYEENNHLREIPLACFALVRHKEDKFNFVSGMNPLLDDSSVILPSDEGGENFRGYAGPGESADKFKNWKEN